MTFSGERLRLIRTFRDLRQNKLAELVAVSAASISQYENGNRVPDPEVVQALCDELGVTTDYFLRGDPNEISEDEADFRKQRSTPRRDYTRVLAYGTLLAEWIRYLQQHARFPALDLPSITVSSYEDVEEAADYCRDHWGLGFGPIRHPTRVLENAGVLVATVEDPSTKIDAFSVFSDDMSFVALNLAKGSSSRSTFDCMHEIGHGVLHRHLAHGPDSHRREEEANFFAGAFLLPRGTFAREFWAIGTPSIARLLELKIRWGVSVQAIIYRARQLGLVSTSQYRRLMKEVSRKGWRSGIDEPEEPEPLKPELLDGAFERFEQRVGAGASWRAASDLGWGPKLFRQISGRDGEMPLHHVQEAEMHSLEEYRTRRA